MHDNTSYLIHLFDKDIEKSIIKFESVINLFKLLDYAVDKNKKTPPYSDVLAYIFGAFPKGDEGKIVKSNFLSKKLRIISVQILNILRKSPCVILMKKIGTLSM